jgi:hypothetical protein
MASATDDIVHLILWVFVGAVAVLILTHASGFATSVNAVGGQVTNDASLLAGYAPVAPAGGTSARSTGGNQGLGGGTYLA